MNTYKRLISYVRPYMGRLIAAIACIILAAGGNLAVPWIIKDVIDQVLINKDMAMLNIIAIGILIIFFLRGIFFFGQTYLMSYIGQRVIIDIREAVYRQLQRLSLTYFDKRQTGAIMSSVTNDVSALQAALVESMVELVTEIMILIGSLGAMFFLHWKLSLLTLITMPLVLQAINTFGKKLRKAGRVLQERAADITAILQETISGIRVIKSFAREDYETDRFKQENFYNFRAQMKTSQLLATLTPVIEFLSAIGVTVSIWYGGMEVIDGNLPLAP